MKILFIADVHIKLGQRNVPYNWQWDRFVDLAKHIQYSAGKHQVDKIIIGGDLLDVPKPSYDEVALMLHFIDMLKPYQVQVFHGNHEALTKTKGCLGVFDGLLNNLEIVGSLRSPDYDIIDYFELHEKTWKPQKSKLLFTHVRGAIPPHVKPEINLDRFSHYELVVAGDLHSFKNSQENIVYPGSPMVTSFHRSRVSGSNGYLIIDTDTLDHDWYELNLPQLIRKTVTNLDDIVTDTEGDHYIYELEGTVDELSAVDVSELDNVTKTVSVSDEVIEELKGDSLEEEVMYFASEKMQVDEDVLSEIPSTINKLRLGND